MAWSGTRAKKKLNPSNDPGSLSSFFESEPAERNHRQYTYQESFQAVEENPDFVSIKKMSDWELATSFHDLKKKFQNHREFKALERAMKAKAIASILRKAKACVKSHERKVSIELRAWDAREGHRDIDLEETIENQLPWVQVKTEREKPLILMVDTSLSMTGEKIALTAVALAVLLIQFQEERIGIIAFENEAVVIKKFNANDRIEDVLSRFLDVPAKGYTHLEEGLKAGARFQKLWGDEKRVSAVLLTDGRYTAGKDPTYLSQKFNQLSAIHLGDDVRGFELCKKIAKLGRGVLRNVKNYRDLPSTLYDVSREFFWFS